MKFKEKYSKEEWELITNTPQLTGLLMSVAEFSGIEGTKQELKACIMAIAEGENFLDNKLIRKIVPRKNTKKKLKEQQLKIIEQLNIQNQNDIGKFQETVFSNYTFVLKILNKYEELITIDEYKLWLLNIAEQVALSAVEGSFFGEEKDPFSEKEKIIFNKINDTLKNN